MVGVFVQQHYLPFYTETYTNSKPFLALKAEAQYRQLGKHGKLEEPNNKGKISGIGELIKKSMKSEQGNATITEVQVGAFCNVGFIISCFNCFISLCN